MRAAAAILALLVTGAAPPAVKVTATGYPLVCGHPTGLFSVTFPGAVKLPARIAVGAVTVNGARPAAVTVKRRTVSITAAKPSGVRCYSITIGTLSIAFARAARVDVGAARTATVKHAAAVYEARVTVSR